MNHHHHHAGTGRPSRYRPDRRTSRRSRSGTPTLRALLQPRPRTSHRRRVPLRGLFEPPRRSGVRQTGSRRTCDSRPRPTPVSPWQPTGGVPVCDRRRRAQRRAPRVRQVHPPSLNHRVLVANPDVPSCADSLPPCPSRPPRSGPPLAIPTSSMGVRNPGSCDLDTLVCVTTDAMCVPGVHCGARPCVTCDDPRVDASSPIHLAAVRIMPSVCSSAGAGPPVILSVGLAGGRTAGDVGGRAHADHQ